MVKYTNMQDILHKQYMMDYMLRNEQRNIWESSKLINSKTKVTPSCVNCLNYDDIQIYDFIHLYMLRGLSESGVQKITHGLLNQMMRKDNGKIISHLAHRNCKII